MVNVLSVVRPCLDVVVLSSRACIVILRPVAVRLIVECSVTGSHRGYHPVWQQRGIVCECAAAVPSGVSVTRSKLRSREQERQATELSRRHMHDPATTAPNKLYITTMGTAMPSLRTVFLPDIYSLTVSRFVRQLHRYDRRAITFIP
jgi:hypothetical protein